MKEIKCPNCGEVFQVDESGYAQIVQQIRDSEFEKELSRRIEELEKRQENSIELIKLKNEQLLDASLREKDNEIMSQSQVIESLKAEKENLVNKHRSDIQMEIEKISLEKDKTIELLKAQIASKETEKEQN